MAESDAVDDVLSWNPALVCQPWQPFSIDGNQYITKAILDESLISYELCISDFKKIWYEKMNEEKFKDLSEELNPNVEAETLYLMRHVHKNIASQQYNTNYQIQEVNGNLQLQLRTKLLPGVSYVWQFNCEITTDKLLGQVLIEPLVAMVAELLRRQNELQALIHKKDMEIQDYRESDVKLSRKSLETKTFDKDSFDKKMSHSTGFGRAIASASRLAFAEQGQELYKYVVERQTWLQSSGSKDDGLPMLWDSVESSPNVSPYTSPQKTATTNTTAKPSLPAVSPSKGRQLQRREELRKKLDEEAERKKRKKKKIKL